MTLFANKTIVCILQYQQNKPELLFFTLVGSQKNNRMKNTGWMFQSVPKTQKNYFKYCMIWISSYSI